MKRFIITALFSLGFGSVALAAPGQIYYNTGFNTNLPIIDDVIFENTGTFEAFVAVSEEIISLYLPDLSYAPYSTRNTLYYTNAGVMEGTPGFLFATTTATTSRGASSFANVSGGVVAAFDDEVLAGGAILTFYGEAAPSLFDTDAAKTYVPDVIYSQPLASQVLIHSTNILNNGTISVGNYGQLQMTGKNINNAGGVLVAGAVNTGSDTDPADTTSGAEFLFDDLNFYVNPAGVYDLFWGVTNGTTLKLDQFAVDLPDTGIDAPLNVTLRGQGNSTFQFPMPLNGNPRFATFVYAYEFNASNTYFNIVFVNTNFTDVNGQANTNITATVEFSPENIAIGTGQSGDVFAYMAMVQFAMPVFDVITRGVVTNAVYLLDDGAAFNPMTDTSMPALPTTITGPTLLSLQRKPRIFGKRLRLPTRQIIHTTPVSFMKQILIPAKT